MIREGRVKGLALFPPVGTFSAAFRPRVRSYKAPLGFRGTLLDSRVKKRNLALLRCLLFLSFALKAGLPAVLTVPKASFASRVAPWRSLRGKPGCGEILLNSCCALEPLPSGPLGCLFATLASDRPQGTVSASPGSLRDRSLGILRCLCVRASPSHWRLLLGGS